MVGDRLKAWPREGRPAGKKDQKGLGSWMKACGGGKRSRGGKREKHKRKITKKPSKPDPDIKSEGEQN